MLLLVISPTDTYHNRRQEGIWRLTFQKGLYRKKLLRSSHGDGVPSRNVKGALAPVKRGHSVAIQKKEICKIRVTQGLLAHSRDSPRVRGDEREDETY
jgi:hypothetical protein